MVGLVQGIISEEFPPKPAYSTCRFCDYWSICEAKESEEEYTQSGHKSERDEQMVMCQPFWPVFSSPFFHTWICPPYTSSL